MLRYQCEYAKQYSGEAYGARMECKQFVSRELRNCELRGLLSRLVLYIIRYVWITIMEFDPKWVHMARYELMLRLDGALWLSIIFKPLLTPKRAFTIQFESYFWMFVTENVSMFWNVTI